MPSLVYVDNSNVWIEGMHVAAVESGMAKSIFDAQQSDICDRNWSYDFGKLLQFAGGEKESIKKAVLFGSRPPKNDSLWEIAKRVGFEVVVYDRNVQNKEKRIDTDITATIMEDSYEKMNLEEDEIILVAGDGDYVPLLEKLNKRKIKTTVCFWDHASKDIKTNCREFVSLNPFLSHLKL